ncbi:small secreted protein [Streptomyces sp.]|uniref:small secreted protein n=1 Tax=Streptomyces sp. TaxID=1931 RepID=UPI002F418449
MEGTHPVKVNKKFSVALSGAAALLLALSGCGGDDTGKKRDEWAKGVCDQAAAQVRKIDQANTAISKVDSGGKPQNVKAADSAAFKAISDAYRSLAGIFSSAGPAPGDEGEKYQQNAVSVFTNLSGQYAALKTQVDGLDTSDQAKFASGLAGVSNSLKQTTVNAEKSLATLSDGDTGNALAAQPGCQQVSGAVSPTAS